MPVVINSGSGNQGMTVSLPVIVFAESKASSDSYAASHPQQNAAPAPSMPSPGAASADGFMNIPDGIDEELPFN